MCKKQFRHYPISLVIDDSDLMQLEISLSHVSSFNFALDQDAIIPTLRSFCKRELGSCTLTQLPDHAKEMIYYQLVLNHYNTPHYIYQLMATNEGLAKKVLNSQDTRFYRHILQVMIDASQDELDASINIKNKHLLDLIYAFPKLVDWASVNTPSSGYIMSLNEIVLASERLLEAGTSVKSNYQFMKFFLSHSPDIKDKYKAFLIQEFLDNAVLRSNLPLMKYLVSQSEWIQTLSKESISEMTEASENEATHHLVKLFFSNPHLRPQMDMVNIMETSLESPDLKTVEFILSLGEQVIPGSTLAILLSGDVRSTVSEFLYKDDRVLRRIPVERLPGLIKKELQKGRHFILQTIYQNSALFDQIPDPILIEIFLDLMRGTYLLNDILPLVHRPGLLIYGLSDAQWNMLVSSPFISPLVPHLLQDRTLRARVQTIITQNPQAGSMYHFMVEDRGFSRELLQRWRPQWIQVLGEIMSVYMSLPSTLTGAKTMQQKTQDALLLVDFLDLISHSFTPFQKREFTRHVDHAIDAVINQGRTELFDVYAEDTMAHKRIVISHMTGVFRYMLHNGQDLSPIWSSNHRWMAIFGQEFLPRALDRIITSHNREGLQHLMEKPLLMEAFEPAALTQTIDTLVNTPMNLDLLELFMSHSGVTDKLFSFITSPPGVSEDTLLSLIRVKPPLLIQLFSWIQSPRSSIDLEYIMDQLMKAETSSGPKSPYLQYQDHRVLIHVLSSRRLTVNYLWHWIKPKIDSHEFDKNSIEFVLNFILKESERLSDKNLKSEIYKTMRARLPDT